MEQKDSLDFYFGRRCRYLADQDDDEPTITLINMHHHGENSITRNTHQLGRMISTNKITELRIARLSIK